MTYQNFTKEKAVCWSGMPVFRNPILSLDAHPSSLCVHSHPLCGYATSLVGLVSSLSMVYVQHFPAFPLEKQNICFPPLQPSLQLYAVPQSPMVT